MSEQIDWSKAPEGYPVWIQGADTNFTSGWYRELFDRYESQKGTYYMKRDSSFFTANYRPTTPSWSGEGLPPVGVVCEVNPDKAGWRKSVISYVGDGFIAWLQVGDLIVPEYGAFIDDCEFRPIRTPEQIAADEREAAIQEMLTGTPWPGSDIARRVCEHVYDAGYRKP